MMADLLSVAFVATVDEVPEELWPACFPPHLEGKWWYQSLESCGIEEQFTFLYAVIRQGERPVGLAPVFLMNVPIDLVLPPALLPVFRLAGHVFPSALYQRTLFVGSPCADEGTVGTIDGIDRRAALLCLAEGLAAKAKDLRASMMVWKDFRSSEQDDFDWLSRRVGLFPMVSFPGTEVLLPSASKADYFAAMKASRRHILKKKLKRSAAAVDIVVEVVERPAPAVLDEIFGLFWQTYEKATTKFERLNRPFFDILAGKPVSRFVILRERASGAMIAFMLCFALDGRMINKFIGIDYQRPKEWLLYFRLWEAALDWALSQGFRSIQSGQTGYAPKIEMGHRLVPLTNYCRHRNPLVHRLYKTIARTIGWQTLDSDLARFLTAHPETAPTVGPGTGN
ncbi:GNAT family N-acetyltransferase [Telmatospirillum sp.]|uniref:GNAT family N-acetyltransferase n=1 Tax=Telmatospirillum sp. TaxID=2079197 RepID=UPI002848BBEC|nr:GNAT family N-acetyltransferase [Telmatospirillum sp.]MDR3440112.1 GNAT family N-acetyltransferase [Telmatospirillum sp.]